MVRLASEAQGRTNMSIFVDESKSTISVMGSFTKEFNVEPQDVAKLFCNFDDTKQAEFFNVVADLVKDWKGGGLQDQLSAIRHNSELSEDGLKVMRMIGEYAN